jgi:predicted TIM-barrel fold metal-dependent hydrolase
MPPLTQPPDPLPKRPRLALPPGCCDCQVHFFGPASRYPFDPGSRYVSLDMLPETYIALQEIVGLSRAVIVSGGGYGRNSGHLADTLARFPNGRFRGVALLAEDTPRAEFARLDRLGVRGLRFVSKAHGAHLPHLSESLAQRAAEFGWHVQYYPAGSDIVADAERLLALPNQIVLDHFAAIPAAGGTDQKPVETVLRLLDTGRVWLKLSGPMRCSRLDFPYADVTPLAHIFVRHAPERLLWGSDWPHVNMNDRQMPNDGDLVDLLGEWVPDDAVRRRILVDNACAVYGFPRPLEPVSGP